MNASLPTPANNGLLFQWETHRGRRSAILLFLIASLLAHAFCFYLFQIVYPPTIALLPPPARVSLITSNSEEGRTLLRWIDAEDPALVFTTLRPSENRLRALAKTSHVPSYTTNEPVLKQLPPVEVDLRPPSAQPPGSVPIYYRSALPDVGVIPTTISFSEDFDVLGALKVPPTKFISASSEPPQNVRFRVAVGGGGAVRYCFPLNSSGDAALDEQAHNFVMRARFAEKTTTMANNGDHALLWGMATLNWGNDVAPPSSPESPVPSP